MKSRVRRMLKIWLGAIDWLYVPNPDEPGTCLARFVWVDWIAGALYSDEIGADGAIGG